MLSVLALLFACANQDPAGPPNDDPVLGTDTTVHPPTDADVDGFPADEDCNDLNVGVYPGAPELCDGLDNNCDGAVDEGLERTYYQDADGDGFGLATATMESCVTPAGYVLVVGDCSDFDAAIHPTASEICDGVDNDCDALTDLDDPSVEDAFEVWTDADLDGYGDPGTAALTCQVVEGTVENDYDCDDLNADVNPNAPEICDALGRDDDCDGLVDDEDPESVVETYWPDSDADGFGDGTLASTTTCFTPSGHAANGEDCDDTRAWVNPDAPEVCDDDADIDEDCDGDADEADSEMTVYSWYVDADADGYGVGTTSGVVTCEIVLGYAPENGDCDDADDTVSPAALEVCDDDIDNDCTGVIDDCQIGVVPVADADLTVEGAAANDFVGSDVTGIGDIDLDGTPDLAIGATGKGTADGSVHLVLGPMSGAITIASTDVEIVGPSGGSMFGWSVAGEGSVDGDLVDDLLVGAHGDDQAILFYGPIDSDTSASAADATVQGGVGDYFGYTVGILEDWNSDGYDEVVVSATLADGVLYDSGVAYVFHGPLTGTIDVADAAFTFRGSDWFEDLGEGSGRMTVGDLDGDGVEDLAVGSPYGGGGPGLVHVVHAGLASGSYDMASIADTTITGEVTGDGIGMGVADHVDYDGDGYDDLATGAWSASAGGYRGAAYVFLGPLDAGDMNASTFDARWDGDANDYAGYDLAGGDLNGDGNTDLLIGAYGHSGSVAKAGGAYVAFGGTMGVNDLSTDAFCTLEGDVAGSLTGYRVDFIDDWNGDGSDELALGGYLLTSGAATNMGSAWVFDGGALLP